MSRFLSALLVLAWYLFPGISFSQVPKEEELRASGAKRLTTEEIRALHSDRTVYHHNIVTDLRLPMWYAAKGTRSLRPMNRSFTGDWIARDDLRCEETLGGPVVCMTIYQRGDEWILCDPRETPECRWRITRSTEGDVERLGNRP